MALMGILTVLLKADITQASHHQITDAPPPKTTTILGCDLDALFNKGILIM